MNIAIAFVMLIEIAIGISGINGNLDRLDGIRRMPSYLLVVLPISPLSANSRGGDLPTRRITSIPAPGRRPGLSLTG